VSAAKSLFAASQLDIRAPAEGHLSPYAFLNATRQNAPQLKPGAVILCGVSSADPIYETMLTCIAVEDSKGWQTKETYLGELENGYWFDVSLAYAQMYVITDNHHNHTQTCCRSLSFSLLLNLCVVPAAISERLKGEMAVGVNGR
jgi:exosome complex RNA-binding protein Rrp4